MPSEIIEVNADQMLPPAAELLWPEMIPFHGITVVSGLRPEGGEALHVVHNTNAPLWVLIGMLDAVRQDLLKMWQSIGYEHGDEEED